MSDVMMQKRKTQQKCASENAEQNETKLEVAFITMTEKKPSFEKKAG